MAQPCHSGDYSDVGSNSGDDNGEGDNWMSAGDTDDPVHPSSFGLNLSKNYVPRWTTCEAFREFYQNWKDGIIQTNNLKLRDFRPVLKNVKTGEVLFIVSKRQPMQSHQPVLHRDLQQAKSMSSQRSSIGQASTDQRSNGVLGFIRFKNGSLELTNFNAELTRENLQIGSSKKGTDSQLAGSHGEGFKVASMVMCRNGYRVRYATSSHYWSFCFRGDRDSNFGCKISAPSQKTIEKQKERASSTFGTAKEQLKAHTWEDVSVQIGTKGKKSGKQVSSEEFWSWTKIALDLCPPSDVIETDAGDLILDERYSGHVYLRGLLLPLGNSRLDKYKYGYNLLHGKINRDRERLTEPGEEARQIARIWQSAIIQGRERIVKKYVELLRSDNERGDVARAEQEVTTTTATSIWRLLVREAGEGAFYYCDQKDGLTNSKLIREHFQQDPLPLPKTLWNILRKSKLIRTPQEQRVHLFERLQPSPVPKTTFAQSVVRGLRASLALDTKTRNISVRFVHGRELGLDVLHLPKEGCLQIHARWLDFKEIHKTNGCEVFQQFGADHSDGKAFFCDHIVTSLYKIALADVLTNSPPEGGELNQLERNLLDASSQKLRRMPREIIVQPNGDPGVLKVCWTDDERGLISKYFGDNINFEVVLHRESTCAALRSELFKPKESIPGNPRTDNQDLNGFNSFPTVCGCHGCVVPRTQGHVLFRGLEDDVEYFPMISEGEDMSFFGLPPEPAKPARQPSSRNSLPSRKWLPAKVVPRKRPRSPFSGIRPSVNSSATQPVSQSSQVDICTLDSESDSSDEDLGTRQNNIDTLNQNRPPRNETQPNNSSVSRLQEYLKNPATALQGLAAERLEGWWRDIDELIHVEDTAWETWERENLEKAFAAFIAKRENLDPSASLKYLTNYSSQRLKFTFEQGQHVDVQVLEHGNKQERYILEIYDVVVSTSASGRPNTYLKATRYSFFDRARASMQGTTSDVTSPILKKELLVHYENFRAAGQLGDAEFVNIDQISTVEEVRYGFGQLEGIPDSDHKIIDFVRSIPPLPELSGYFCRYAIRSSHSGATATLKSVASLLRGPKGLKPPRFKPTSLINSAVVDLSPHVAGLAEGFAKASFNVRAALGFDDGRDLTWQARNLSAQLYSGSLKEILAQCVAANSAPSGYHDCDVPKVYILAGQERRFFLKQDAKENEQSLCKFLESLQALDTVAMSEIRPEFLVFITSSAILHEKAAFNFTASIFKLLRMDFTVHLRKANLSDWGLPQNHTVVILVASSFHTEFDWAIPKQPLSIDSGQRKSVRDFMGDLDFANPHVNGDGKTGLFACGYTPSGPVTDLMKGFRTASRRIPSMAYVIHNHRTGFPWRGTCAVDLDAKTLSSLTCRGHSTRGDLLTVREIARLQGFADDFLFYSSNHQYHQVINAVSPLVSMSIAIAIRDEIDRFKRNEGSSDQLEPTGARESVSRRVREQEPLTTQSASSPPQAKRARVTIRDENVPVKVAPSDGSTRSDSIVPDWDHLTRV